MVMVVWCGGGGDGDGDQPSFSAEILHVAEASSPWDQINPIHSLCDLISSYIQADFHQTAMNSCCAL